MLLPTWDIWTYSSLWTLPSPPHGAWRAVSPWGKKWQPTWVFIPLIIPCTEKSGRLQSMGTQRVRHDWGTTRVGMQYFSPLSREQTQDPYSGVLTTGPPGKSLCGHFLFSMCNSASDSLLPLGAWQWLPSQWGHPWPHCVTSYPPSTVHL